MAMSSILSKPFTSTLHDPITKPPSTRPCLGSASSNFFLPIGNHGFRFLTSVKQDQRKKGMAIKCNIQPIPSTIPSGPPSAASGPGKGWLVGIVLTVILPFLRMRKWGPLLFYKNRVDVTLQRVEDAVEMLEKVANRVDEGAKELSKKLPQGKLKNVVGLIEQVAKKAARDAHLLDAVIDKVQELEEQVENYMETSISKTMNTSEEANANNIDA